MTDANPTPMPPAARPRKFVEQMEAHARLLFGCTLINIGIAWATSNVGAGFLVSVGLWYAFTWRGPA